MVNWDEASMVSMRTHINQIDVLVPEWIHLTAAGGMELDSPELITIALQHIKASPHQPAVMPLINNYVDGEWRGDVTHDVLATPEKRERLIQQLHTYVTTRKFAGITIDFQELPEDDAQAFQDFFVQLANRFHASGLAVNVTLPLVGSAVDAHKLAESADAVVVMAYDQHAVGSQPGPVAAQSWIEKGLKSRVAEIGPNKMVVGLANYGYDWRDGSEEAEVHTFPDVLLRARQAEAEIRFDKSALNPTFEYNDIDNEHREVWFLDAVTAFNQIRAARQHPIKGIAIWRLGAEDVGIWSIFENLSKPNPEKLTVLSNDSDVEYHGNGEVLKVVASPLNGRREIRMSETSDLIVDETVKEFPRSYEIARWGGNRGKTLALTFDDGPDPTYTPAILDVLKAHNVPATFFVLGSQVNRYPDIARRIVAEGHELGNHTFSHPNFDHVTPFQIRVEVNSTQRILETVTGRATLMFRPPFAIDIEPRTADQIGAVKEISDRGYYTVNMNIDGIDWYLHDPKAIAKRVIDEVHTNNGHIILLHDAGGDRSATVKALPVIIETLKAEGYSFTGVAELIGKTRDDLMPVVDPSVDPLMPLDRIGYGMLRAAEWSIGAVFTLAIALGLTRLSLIFLLALRKRRSPSGPVRQRHVGVIVPAYNEEKVIAHTIRSLLASTWTKLDILVVDDGSTDATAEVVRREFAKEPRVRVVTKENAGKSEALNYGIGLMKREILIALDADTVFLPDTIANLMRNFDDPNVAAVAGNAKVGNRINLLTRCQAVEYMVAQNLDRRAFERLNCISVVPGAIGAWRRRAIIEAGGFTTDTLAEDADLTIRIIRNNHKVVFDDEAIALTEAPATVRQFVKQRFRWTFGMMQTAFKHGSALTRSRPNTIGLVALPNIVLFQLVFPCIAPLADIAFLGALVSTLVGSYVYADNPLNDGVSQVFLGYLMFLAVDYFVAVVAFLRERNEQPSLLLTLLVQRFFYRQILYYVVLKAVVVAISGRAVGWFKLDRKATVTTAGKALMNPVSSGVRTV